MDLDGVAVAEPVASMLASGLPVACLPLGRRCPSDCLYGLGQSACLTRGRRCSRMAGLPVRPQSIRLPDPRGTSCGARGNLSRLGYNVQQMADPGNGIEVESLVKVFKGGVRAVDGIDL